MKPPPPDSREPLPPAPPVSDPQVVTHPDGTQTYTPGYRRRKLAAVVFGAFLVAFGVFWQWTPLRLVLGGETTTATVVAVMETKPGQPARRLDTRKAVEEAEDFTRHAVYTYHIQFPDQRGGLVAGVLNYGQVLRPLYSIGDEVTISYDPRDPSRLTAKWSIRTWTFGLFFVGIGLLIFIPQLLIYRAAHRPIVLDQIVDYDAWRRSSASRPPRG